jgi:hypothetical protein
MAGSGRERSTQDVLETLSSLGIANDKLLEDTSRAATAMEQDGVRLTEDDISAIADAVMERLLSRTYPSFPALATASGGDGATGSEMQHST